MSLDFMRYFWGVALPSALLAGCVRAAVPVASPPTDAFRRVGHLDKYSSVYSFQAKPDGQNPEARVIPFDGSLFGTTPAGGTKCALRGCGTIFKITTGGKETVLHRFQGLSDGLRPLAELAAVKNLLYGTTDLGGVVCIPRAREGCGTVFSTDASGNERVLHAFEGIPDGANPQAPLTLANGLLYGTTIGGGSMCAEQKGGCGTIFSIDTKGNETVLYRFQGEPDGWYPTGNLLYLNGMLYGTTLRGGPKGYGTVFAVTPSGSEHIIYSGSVQGDIDGPSGLVAMGGALYGSAGGGKNDEGAIYALTTSGSIRIIHNFTQQSRNGRAPQGRLIGVAGLLYGTALGGLGAENYGIVYSVSPSGQFSVIYWFKGAPDGAYPYAGVSDAKGTLYGTTYGGGSGCHYNCAAGYGTVFRILR